jgi:hypothetical protein
VECHVDENRQSLTGVWNGLYSYADGLSVSFMATLIDSGRSLSGATREPNVLGTSPGRMLSALLSGDRQDRAISFVKIYDETGPRVYSPVSYEGVLNGDATEVEGQWRISDGTSGKFLMIRSGGQVSAIEQKKHAKA